MVSDWRDIKKAYPPACWRNGAVSGVTGRRWWAWRLSSVACVQNAILADGVVHATQGKITFALAACLSGGILTLLVIFGFIGLSWTAKLALPLFAVIVGWIFYSMLRDSSLLALMTLPPHGPMMSLGAGATMVAGGAVVGALITPDITRYCQSGKHVFWMITISYLIGEFAINGIAILVAHALHTAGVVIIMTQSAGWLGLVTVILSALKVNDTALYSSSLAVTHLLEVFTKKKFSYRRITCMLGIFGTLLSVLGILGQFTGFLIMLGILFPPIAGVMMVDYYLIRNSRALLDATRHQGKLPASEATPAVGWTALCAWLVGSIAGFTVQVGIPSLNALLAASAVYWLLHSVGVAVRWRCS